MHKATMTIFLILNIEKTSRNKIKPQNRPLNADQSLRGLILIMVEVLLLAFWQTLNKSLS